MFTPLDPDPHLDPYELFLDPGSGMPNNRCGSATLVHLFACHRTNLKNQSPSSCTLAVSELTSVSVEWDEVEMHR